MGTYADAMENKWIAKGERRGERRGLKKGLKALVNSLKEYVKDFDSLYNAVIRNEEYKNVTEKLDLKGLYIRDLIMQEVKNDDPRLR